MPEIAETELHYSIVRAETADEIRLEAKPNEWACKVEATIEKRGFMAPELSAVYPRICGITWSSGSRNWTVDDARKFFQAGLDLMDAAEAELAALKAVTEASA